MKDSVPTIVKYAKVELVPPKPSELKEVGPAIRNIISSYRSKGWKNLTVKVVFNVNIIFTKFTVYFY